MQVVGGGDDDGIGKFGPFKHIFPGVKPVLFGDVVFLGVAFVADGNGLCHTHNVELIGEVEGITAIYVAA